MSRLWGIQMFTGVPGAAIEEGPTHLDGPASLGTGKARAYSVYSGGFAATYTNDGSTADQFDVSAYCSTTTVTGVACWILLVRCDEEFTAPAQVATRGRVMR